MSKKSIIDFLTTQIIYLIIATLIYYFIDEIAHYPFFIILILFFIINVIDLIFPNKIEKLLIKIFKYFNIKY